MRFFIKKIKAKNPCILTGVWRFHQYLSAGIFPVASFWQRAIGDFKGGANNNVQGSPLVWLKLRPEGSAANTLILFSRTGRLRRFFETTRQRKEAILLCAWRVGAFYLAFCRLDHLPITREVCATSMICIFCFVFGTFFYGYTGIYVKCLF